MAEPTPAPAPPPPPPSALLPALASFERGDLVSASSQARSLLDSTDPEVQAAARALVDRMAPDPWAIRFGLLSLGILVLLILIYVR